MAFAPPQDPNETLFRMVRACLTADVGSESELYAVRSYFQLWLLRLGGFLPDWSNCFRCGRVFEEAEFAYTDSDQHLLCPGCNRADAGRRVSGKVRSLFVRARSISPEVYAKFASASDNEIAMRELDEILRKIIANALGSDRISRVSSV